MSEPAEGKPKRRFWQIHLSTAVVLLLVAGALVGLNLRKQKLIYNFIISNDRSSVREPTAEQLIHPDFTFIERGWPYQFLNERSEQNQLFGSENDAEKFFLGLRAESGAERLRNLDIAIACAILLAVCFIAEWFLRRREGRKT
jgi:hypothetical protein